MDRAELQIVLTEQPQSTVGPAPAPSSQLPSTPSQPQTVTQPSNTQSQPYGPFLPTARPFDPVLEAQRRHGNEEAKRLVDEAYARLYPKIETPKPSPIGQAAVSTLTGAGAGGFGAIGSTITAAATALGPLGVAAVAAAGGLFLLNRSVNSLAERYGDYSPAIATAQAFAEIRQTFGDMRRAQQIGPQFARYIEAQSRLEQTWADTEIELLKLLVPLAQDILNVLNPILKAVNVLLDLPDILTEIMADPLNALNIIRRRVEQAVDNLELGQENQSPEPRSIIVPEL